MYKKTTTITEEFENPPMSSTMMGCPSAVHSDPALLIQLMEYTKMNSPTIEQITTMVERMYAMSAMCKVLTMTDYAAITAP